MKDANVALKKGYKYRIYLNKKQQEALAKTYGSCRYVYNRLLAEVIEEYKLYKELNKKGINTSSINNIIDLGVFSAKITKWRKEEATSWLSEISSVALQQASRNLYKAFKSFFSRKGSYPKFKAKHKSRDSATYTKSGFRIENDKLYLANIKEGFKIKLSRDLPSAPSSCVLSTDPSGKTYVSFICDYIPSRKSGEGIVGIDVGITHLAVTSHGEFLNNPKYFINNQKKLAKLQKRHAKKQKGSKNRNKARIKVARQYAKIANCRNDYIHKLSSRLISENQAIAIERLMVKNMIRNRHLAKHIADAGWGRFKELLQYKTLETDKGKLLLADPYFPSTQLCSFCGRKPTDKIKLGVTKWKCLHCKAIHQRDLNAARNLEIYLRATLKNWTDKAKIMLADRYISIC